MTIKNIYISEEQVEKATNIASALAQNYAFRASGSVVEMHIQTVSDEKMKEFEDCMRS